MKNLLRHYLGIDQLATTSAVDLLRDQLAALARRIDEWPTREELARQKASWAGFLVEYEGIADRVGVLLKRMGARSARALDAGQNWSDPIIPDEDQLPFSAEDFRRDKEGL